MEMTLKECLFRCPFDGIAVALNETVLLEEDFEERRESLREYEGLYYALLERDADENKEDAFIVVAKDLVEDIQKGDAPAYDWDVSGYDPQQGEERMSYVLTPFEQWLGMEVCQKSIEDYGLAVVLAAILVEMQDWGCGFSDEVGDQPGLQHELQKAAQRMEEMEAAGIPEGYISFEELKEQFYEENGAEIDALEQNADRVREEEAAAHNRELWQEMVAACKAQSEAMRQAAQAYRPVHKAIFVSSTFQDMHGERDILRDRVLPLVNQFAAQYGREVDLIDLRWGVDTADIGEAEQNKKVLRACLSEIDRSRPFFIGILGERYGWIPDPQDLLPVLADTNYLPMEEGRSVTAIEMEYGALSAPQPPLGLFYFREMGGMETLPTEMQGVYQDGAEGREKLEALKAAILEKYPQGVRRYIAAVDKGQICGLEEFARMLTEDIIAALGDEWGPPPMTAPTWQEKEESRLEMWRYEHTRGFTGREAIGERLVSFCLNEEEESPLLMLVGEDGIGKSALLAKVMEQVAEEGILLPFACGISSRSSRVEDMLLVWIAILERKLGQKAEKETRKSFLRTKDRFMELLHEAAVDSRVIIIADGLEKLFPTVERDNMLWLTGELPKNLRVLVSGVADGQDTAAFLELGGRIESLMAMGEEETLQMLRAMAGLYHKELPQVAMDAMLEKRTPQGALAAGHPLYASLMVEDLVMMRGDEHQKIWEKTREGMAAMDAIAAFMVEQIAQKEGNIQSAYRAILQRLEGLMEDGAVSGMLCLLALSRYGLREKEIAGAFENRNVPFYSADFAWLRQMLKGHVSQGADGEWALSHQSLREAVLETWGGEASGWNEALARHMERNLHVGGPFSLGIDEWNNREIMHHLWLAGDAKRAATIISEAPREREGILHARCLADIYEKEGNVDFLLAILAEAAEILPQNAWRIGELYWHTLMDALPPSTPQSTRLELLTKARETVERLDEEGNENSLRAISAIYTRMGACHAALGQKEAERECAERALVMDEKRMEKKVGMDGLRDVAVATMDVAAGKAGEEAALGYDEALTLLIEIHRDSGEIEDLRDLVTAYGKAGEAWLQLGHYEAALERLENAHYAAQVVYEMTEESGDLYSFAISEGALADYHQNYGTMVDATQIFMECCDTLTYLYERTGEVGTLAMLSQMASRCANALVAEERVFLARSYFEQALAYGEKLAQKREEIGALRRLSKIQSDYGALLHRLNLSEKAHGYIAASLETDERIHGMTGTTDALRDLSASYSYMGNDLFVEGKLEEAMAYYQKAYDAGNKVLAGSPYPNDWANQGVICRCIYRTHWAMGQRLEGRRYLEEAVEASKTGYERGNTLHTGNVYGEILYYLGVDAAESGDRETAEDCYRKAIALHQELYEKHGAAETRRELARYHMALGDLYQNTQTQQAVKEYRYAYGEYKALYENAGDMAALWDVALAAVALGNGLFGWDAKEAQKLFEAGKEYFAILFRKTGGVDALRNGAICTFRLGDCMRTLDMADNGKAAYEEAMAMLETVLAGEENLENLWTLAYYAGQLAGYCGEERQEEAMAYYQRAVELYTTHYQRSRADYSGNNLGINAYRLGDIYRARDGAGTDSRTMEAYDVACTAYQAVYEDTRTMEALRQVGFIHAHVGEYLEERERWEEAARYTAIARDAYQRVWEEGKEPSALDDVARETYRLGTRLADGAIEEEEYRAALSEIERAIGYYTALVEREDHVYDLAQLARANIRGATLNLRLLDGETAFAYATKVVELSDILAQRNPERYGDWPETYRKMAADIKTLVDEVG
ncbi:DUF4062 domain-containing protein [Eubacteriales bacterium OttesenSCG-928-M02]|nr:DUF4062 domain-containing protein [Eubacteriales bacterium OttesenSCG-928-M02]